MIKPLRHEETKLREALVLLAALVSLWLFNYNKKWKPQCI